MRGLCGERPPRRSCSSCCSPWSTAAARVLAPWPGGPSWDGPGLSECPSRQGMAGPSPASTMPRSSGTGSARTPWRAWSSSPPPSAGPAGLACAHQSSAPCFGLACACFRACFRGLLGRRPPLLWARTCSRAWRRLGRGTSRTGASSRRRASCAQVVARRRVVGKTVLSEHPTPARRSSELPAPGALRKPAPLDVARLARRDALLRGGGHHAGASCVGG